MKNKPSVSSAKKKLRVSCYSHDPAIGYTRILAVFEDGNTALDQESAQSKAMYWLDDLLVATKKFSLFSALNNIQAECNLDKNPPPFPDKTTMPLCIVNLVLKEHGLEIEE